ncbi:MAG: nitrate reductase molybdenum cofactor assembly chaperone [Mangrovibacterium sp.]
MQNTYKILSLLLDYPDKELKDNLSNIMQIIDEDNYLNEAQKEGVQEFVNYAQALSLSEWQMQYVQMFDFSSHNNLYLFDHVYGDSRERGQAMVDLTEMYTKSGFEPSSDELPDYLPLFLEYLSLLSDKEGVEKLLSEVSHIINNMKEALEKKNATYYHLLEMLIKH